MSIKISFYQIIFTLRIYDLPSGLYNVDRTPTGSEVDTWYVSSPVPVIMFQNITIISKWTAWGKLKSKVPRNPQDIPQFPFIFLSFTFHPFIFFFLFIFLLFILLLITLVSSACPQTLISPYR